VGSRRWLIDLHWFRCFVLGWGRSVRCLLRWGRGFGCPKLVHCLFDFVVELLLADKSEVGFLIRLGTRTKTFVTPETFSLNLVVLRWVIRLTKSTLHKFPLITILAFNFINGQCSLILLQFHCSHRLLITACQQLLDSIGLLNDRRWCDPFDMKRWSYIIDRIGFNFQQAYGGMLMFQSHALLLVINFQQTQFVLGLVVGLLLTL